tara:strand:+ start:1378 stop:1698 length:321 start_codon:yes stop_codon:yes gene_type:complete
VKKKKDKKDATVTHMTINEIVDVLGNDDHILEWLDDHYRVMEKVDTRYSRFVAIMLGVTETALRSEKTKEVADILLQVAEAMDEEILTEFLEYQREGYNSDTDQKA